MCEDVDQAVHLFTTKVNNILDTFQVRKKYAPWLSDETKEVLEQRNNAQKKASTTRNPDGWRQYTHLCDCQDEKGEENLGAEKAGQY